MNLSLSCLVTKKRFGKVNLGVYVCACGLKHTQQSSQKRVGWGVGTKKRNTRVSIKPVFCGFGGIGLYIFLEIKNYKIQKENTTSLVQKKKKTKDKVFIYFPRKRKEKYKGHMIWVI